MNNQPRYRARIRSHVGGGQWINKTSCSHYRWWMPRFVYYSIQVYDVATGEVVDRDNGYRTIAQAHDDAMQRIGRHERRASKNGRRSA